MRNFLNYKLILATLLMISPLLFGQHTPSDERGEPGLRRSTDIDGNNVRATIFNTGLTGRTGGSSNEIAYEWPKNTNREHVALTAYWAAADFPDIIDTDETDLPTLKLASVVQWRSAPDGRTLNFEPVPGYNDPNYLEERDFAGSPTGNKKVGIAKSIDPNSWPQDGWRDKREDPSDPGWIGSWNGFFGKNIFNADQELFYKMSDDLANHKLHLFQPDSTDMFRGGLGLLVDVRVMAWSQVLVNDVVFILQNTLNDGTGTLTNMAVAIWLADVIGQDTQNDRMNYDLINDLATMDDDEPQYGSVGVAYLETPGNAADRIDNNGNGESEPKVTEALISGEFRGNFIDDNGNGLIDEDTTHVPFADQEGVSYADRMDYDGNGEFDSPLVTSSMVSQASGDTWKRWPPDPENDPIQNGAIHLIMVESDDEGLKFKDFIDNDGNSEIAADNSNEITQAIIDEASNDFYRRYKVPGTDIILYDVGPEDLGKRFADGIDNDNDGVIDENIDEGIDDGIDESRNDGLDNDGDWDPTTDDVGLDGVEGTGDFGENDGLPTSGAGTPFPGEPNIDKTDVSESDQLGITNVQRFPAGSLNFAAVKDRVIWGEYMRPGQFFRLGPGQQEEGENDLTVSSSVFPLDNGNIETISYAVILGESPDDVLKNREKALEVYNADFQFAKAPATPILWAVPGDNQVTLYWDNEAEASFDNFLRKLGLPGFDFEGYRLYRSQDPAFEDIFTITDGGGARTFYKPIAQWDIIDGYFDYGFDSDNDGEVDTLNGVGVNGVQFFLGDNTGLVHSYVDTDVKNGFTYYYALTSYDYGAAQFNIGPAESPILVTVNAVGEASLGKNVVEVTPEAPVAGYQPAEITDVVHVSGSAGGEINFNIIDPRLVPEGRTLRMTFSDTLIEGRNATVPDTFTTRAFTLIDITGGGTPDTLIKDDKAPVTNLESAMVYGMRFEFVNPLRLSVNNDKSTVSRSDVFPLVFEPFNQGATRGEENPADYRIEFGEVGIGQSTEFSFLIRQNPPQSVTIPAKPVNFTITDLGTGEPVQFGFVELETADNGEGFFDAKGIRSDLITFLEPDANDELQITWSVSYETGPVLLEPGFTFAQSGDVVEYILDKPFLSSDVYEFTTKGEAVDNTLASQSLDAIKVVPNPYLAASRFETRNPFNRGRGPRRIHFTHLPQECTIRIFTVNGELVDTIEHDSELADGSAEWDLLTKDNLDVSYGIYIYHIEAPGVGEKVGKFAIIK